MNERVSHHRVVPGVRRDYAPIGYEVRMFKCGPGMS